MKIHGFWTRQAEGVGNRREKAYREAKEAENPRPLTFRPSDRACWELSQSILGGEEKPGCNLETFLVNA